MTTNTQTQSSVMGFYDTSTVHTTDNYSILKKLHGNRDISMRHVERLVDEMKTKGFSGAPILVNQSLEVLDGQHRLEAAKKLKIPVKFLVVEGGTVQDVIEWNTTQEKWVAKDVITSESKRGNHSYKLLESFIADSGVTVSFALRLFGVAGSADFNQFKRGNWELTDSKYTEAKTVYTELAQIAELCPQVLKPTPLSAYKRIRKLKNFRFDEFLRNVGEVPQRIPRQGRRAEYIDAFAGVYNHRRKAKRIKYSK